MADWTSNRSAEAYTFRRVSWATWQELERYDNITGGKLSFAELSDLKISGSLTFDGTAPDKVDLVRVHYTFTDDKGQTEEKCLATCFVTLSKVTHTATREGLRAGGEVELASVLKVPRDKQLGAPLTIPAGTAAVAYVKDALESMGLRVVAAESDYTTPAAYTFEAQATWLSTMNTLLNMAGFGGMKPDAFGAVVLSKYVAPSKRAPVFTFRDDERSVIYPGVADETSEDVANVCRMVHQTDEECLFAVASNIDPMSASSLANTGGREVTLFEDVDELAGDTTAERLENLIAKAATKLKDNSAEIVYTTISHALVPLSTGDGVAVEYGGKTWNGTEMELAVALEPSTKCTSRVRSYSMPDLKIETGGGIAWAL